MWFDICSISPGNKAEQIRFCRCHSDETNEQTCVSKEILWNVSLNLSPASHEIRREYTFRSLVKLMLKVGGELVIGTAALGFWEDQKVTE